MSDYAVFKVGKLRELKSAIEVEETEDGCLYFFITSDSNLENYSLSFQSTITKEEFLSFEIGKEIDLLEFIDVGDVVFGENGSFNLHSNFDLKINRYVPHSFLLILSVRTNDTYLYIENEFKI